MGIFKRSKGKELAAPAEQVPDFQTATSAAPGIEPLSIQAIHRHLYVTFDGTWATYVLGPVNGQHISVGDRLMTVSAQAHRLAELLGTSIVLRGTSTPYDHKEMARLLDEKYPPQGRPLKPGTRAVRRSEVEGSQRTFDDLVHAMQIHMQALGARRPVTYMMVQVTDQKLKAEDLPFLLSRVELPDNKGILEKHRRRLREITDAVARPGYEAKPANTKALGWLIHASVGMGTRVPALLLSGERVGWSEDEIPGFTNAVFAGHNPYAPTTVLQTMRMSQQVTTHVAVLHADKLEERDLENRGRVPYLAWVHGIPEFPVEYVARFSLIPGSELRAEAERNVHVANSVVDHYKDHGEAPPPARQRAIAAATETADQIVNGDLVTSARARGVVMFAVTGPTEEDTIERARALTTAMAEQQDITLAHDYGQYHSYRAFIPGEPIRQTGHVTQPQLGMLAAAIPNSSTAGGDPFGMLIGPVAGGREVYVHDSHGGSFRKGSNTQVVIAAQGHGKSFLMGSIVDFEATCGVQTVAYDPAAQWQKLADLSWHKHDARVYDLSRAKPGTLVPSVMVPVPVRAMYDTEAEWKDAVSEAKQDRMDLSIDVIRDLLPYSMVISDPGGHIIGSIEDAVVKAGGEFGTNPWEIVDAFEQMAMHGNEYAGRIAKHLRARAELKDGALIFPERHLEVDDESWKVLNQQTLTVITMKDLELPPKDGTDRSLWSRKQQQALPIVNLGSWFATRLIHANQLPKAIILDEAGISAGSAASSFRPLINRAAFGSRKWAANVVIGAQTPETIRGINNQIGTLVGHWWLGQMDAETAADALPLIGLPVGHGYEQEIAMLQRGQWVVRDWPERGRADRVRKIQHDAGYYHPELIRALDSNPGGEAATYDYVGELYGEAVSA